MRRCPAWRPDQRRGSGGRAPGDGAWPCRAPVPDDRLGAGAGPRNTPVRGRPAGRSFCAAPRAGRSRYSVIFDGAPHPQPPAVPPKRGCSPRASSVTSKLRCPGEHRQSGDWAGFPLACISKIFAISRQSKNIPFAICRQSTENCRKIGYTAVEPDRSGRIACLARQSNMTRFGCDSSLPN